MTIPWVFVGGVFMGENHGMSMKLQPVRGTQDLLGEEYLKHAHITQVAENIAHLYGYAPIATPLFEYTPVFKRTLGETSDVVGKEMYTFTDRGGEEITLRPEGTAGVVRAVISAGLTQSMPLKLCYNGPMLRYERPQLGRRRQFHQFGVECLGIAHPLSDVETIAMGAQILDRLHLLHRVTLEMNTLGDMESRARYRAALITYLTPYVKDLSADSQERLHKNPLRILDSKSPQDQEITANAPSFSGCLNDESTAFFEKVCAGLSDLGINYRLNERLVRGLDYYNHTAFEFVTNDLGAQGTVLAGGRYDGLMAQMGGPQTPGVGWAMGIERLALMLDPLPPAPQPVAVIPIGGDDMQHQAFLCAMSLRQAGVFVDVGFSGNVGKRMKRADKVNARLAILFGEDEFAVGKATVRDLMTGVQKLVEVHHLIDYVLTYGKSVESEG